MPKFASLDPKFSNISIVKNKVPWVDKLFQDIKNNQRKEDFEIPSYFYAIYVQNCESFSFSQNARGADGAG